MTNRADIIITVLVIISIVQLLLAGVLAFLVSMASGTFVGILGCYTILASIFLEIYSQRG